jgi:hydroxypyruvate reductase/glycerate 2-kinase
MIKNEWIKIACETIESISPFNLMANNISINNGIMKIQNYQINLNEFEKIKVFGSGKAAIEMAKAISEKLKGIDFDGLVVCNYKEKLDKIKVVTGGHPVPDKNSINSAKRLINELEKLTDKDFFIFLLSGGSSAMIELPEENLVLEDISQATKIFLKSGMDIKEINSLRHKLSKVKGGKLKNFTKANGIILVLSDVIGNNLEFIGSGPFYSANRYMDTSNIISKYKLEEQIDENILKTLKTKQKYPDKNNFKHFIIGDLNVALKNASSIANNMGYSPCILTDTLSSEAKEVGKIFASVLGSILMDKSCFKPPVCILAGGETIVIVKGNGIGGRNAELTLSMLNYLPYTNGSFCAGSFGTDGIDGTTNAAGAYFDENIFDKISEFNLNLTDFLNNNDSGTFFKNTGYEFITGKTGTNVGDILMILVKEY